MRRRLAAAVVGVLTAGSALFLAGLPPAAAAGASRAGVTLLAQTPFVNLRGLFGLRVSVSGAGPDDQIVVTVYDHLITRTAFDQAAAGHLDDFSFYQPVVPLSRLATDPAGGYDLQLPVNQPSPAGSPFPTVQAGETGVFPVQISLAGPSGSRLGGPLTTFLVFSEGTATAQGYPMLSAAVVVPVASPPAVAPDGHLVAPGPAEAARLNRLAGVLDADSAVPASVLASPLTLSELAAGAVAGSSVDRGTMADLAGVPDGGLVQVLPSAFSPTPPGDLQAAQLGSEVEPQLATGASVLRSTFGAPVGTRTWAVDGPVDAATLSVLADHGARQLIVPDNDLTALSDEIDTTFAKATRLDSANGDMTAIGADAGITADFTRNLSPVLAANQLLAELAMIYTEAPGEVSRAIAVMPPPGWTVSPAFMSTLLDGLRGNPLVRAVTADSLFTAAGSPLGTRSLVNPDPPPSPAVAALAGESGAIGPARQGIDDLGAVLPSQSADLRSLSYELLLAESESLTDAQRSAVLRLIDASTGAVEHAVTLPPATSITLTSTEGLVPITILAAGALHPRIQLVLNSQRLIFRAFSPPGGTCAVPALNLEICTFSLVTQNTTVKVPVETRSSGVFPLEVTIDPPGSSTVLAHDQDTVRSTAVSGVAVVLIVVALLSLLLWWGRDLRRGRRPKGMVPSPTAEPGAETGVETGAGAVDDFFSRPPPDYGPGLMSPTRTGGGPTELTERHGPGRETRN